jgi:hypothetical protein
MMIEKNRLSHRNTAVQRIDGCKNVAMIMTSWKPSAFQFCTQGDPYSTLPKLAMMMASQKPSAFQLCQQISQENF